MEDPMQQGKEGWVWDPEVRLVREDDEHHIELDFTVRIFSGRFQAEYAWVRHAPVETEVHVEEHIAVFRDWDADNLPVYSPQWRANETGGVDIPGNPYDYEPERGARLIVPEDPDWDAAVALLKAAYELDS